MKISAYLSLHDDWDLLDVALSSVVDLVDEIVVVDGAYKWMAPLFHAEGRDPSRSVDRVYDVLARFGSKVRVVTGIWENEVAKRHVGFNSTAGAYVLRIDADEVLFVDPAMFDAFLSSGKAVAEMEMPIYLAPGYIRRRSLHEAIERQSFVFDRSRISGGTHVDYLWLVLTPREQSARSPIDGRLVFDSPVAFNAHLTHWRPPSSALTRARFYVMNYLRSGGSIRWAPKADYGSAGGFADLVERVPPGKLADLMLMHEIVSGVPPLGEYAVGPTPLTGEDEKRFIHLHDQFLDGLAELNDGLSAGRHVPHGADFWIDLSREANVRNIVSGGHLTLTFGDKIKAARAAITCVQPSAPYARSVPCACEWDDATLILRDIGSFDRGDAFQVSVAISAWTESRDAILACRTGGSAPERSDNRGNVMMHRA